MMCKSAIYLRYRARGFNRDVSNFDGAGISKLLWVVEVKGNFSDLQLNTQQHLQGQERRLRRRSKIVQTTRPPPRPGTGIPDPEPVPDPVLAEETRKENLRLRSTLG